MAFIETCQHNVSAIDFMTLTFIAFKRNFNFSLFINSYSISIDNKKNNDSFTVYKNSDQNMYLELFLNRHIYIVRTLFISVFNFCFR